jgi:hypothetical protein
MKIKYFAFAFSLVLACSLNAAAQNYDGVWTGIVTESKTDCKKVGKAEPGEYKLTFIQQGDELTAMENTNRRPYKGVVEKDNPRSVIVRGTYPETGGYVTEAVRLEFDDDFSGNGYSVWVWSDGWLQCGGNFRFTLLKDQPK